MIELQFKGNRLVVNPEQGAAISLWSCQKNGKTITPIDTNGSNSYESSLLFPFPNRLTEGRYEFEGKEYQFALNDSHRPNALHGFISELPFELVDHSENALNLKLIYEGDRDEYPFPFDLEINYELLSNELKINIEVTNAGKGNMPCGFGWHPYFNAQISDESPRLKLPKVSSIGVNEDLIPNGEESLYKQFQDFESIESKSFDQCFRLERIEERMSVFLSYPKLGSLEVWQDVNFPFVQAFKYNEKTIAIEPMTCGINALNTKEGLMVLSPDQKWKFKMGLRFY